MRTYFFCFTLCVLALLGVGCARGDGAAPEAVRSIPPSPPPPECRAVDSFRERLRSEGRDPASHGIYVEALNDHSVLACSNEAVLYNPASVVKVATSLAALDALGQDHRFVTEFRAVGELDKEKGLLNGDLILLSGRDPSFSITDARVVGDALRQLGVRRVTGDLVVVGAFNCNENSQTDVSAGVFRRQSRVPVSGRTRFEDGPASPVAKPGRLLFRLESDRLLDIIKFQNAYSVNSMADMLASHFGGTEGVRRFLIEKIGINAQEVCLSAASGLDFNRLSAKSTVGILRTLVEWCNSRGIAPDAVMPVAGIESSTLSDRFTEAAYAGSVVAKTGTLHFTDGGVASLAGIAYTAGHGPVLFTLYDMAGGRGVEHLRRLQDDFLKDLMAELGGPDTRSSNHNPTESPRETRKPLSRLLFPSDQNSD